MAAFKPSFQSILFAIHILRKLMKKAPLVIETLLRRRFINLELFFHYKNFNENCQLLKLMVFTKNYYF